MVSQTFENLNAEKKKKIENALLDEFSKYSIEEAQVSRIVKSAGIPRGSFYSYFEDQYDAYSWILGQVLDQVHSPIRKSNDSDSIEIAKKFIEHVDTSEYYNFLRQYYLVNSALITHYFEKRNRISSISNDFSSKSDLTRWLKKISSHELIKTFFTNRDQKKAIIEQLELLDNYFQKKEDK